MINSYETEKFEEGKEYWTYFMEMSNRGNRLRNYTGIMKVRLEKKEVSSYKLSGYYKTFKILQSKPLGSTIAHNIYAYMEGYGTASCDFFETEDECNEAHDKKLISLSKNLNTADREVILKKLVATKRPAKSKIETESIDWYNNLSKTEQKYVKWIKDYYEEI